MRHPTETPICVWSHRLVLYAFPIGLWNGTNTQLRHRRTCCHQTLLFDSLCDAITENRQKVAKYDTDLWCPMRALTQRHPLLWLELHCGLMNWLLPFLLSFVTTYGTVMGQCVGYSGMFPPLCVSSSHVPHIPAWHALKQEDALQLGLT